MQIGMEGGNGRFLPGDVLRKKDSLDSPQVVAWLRAGWMQAGWNWAGAMFYRCIWMNRITSSATRSLS